MGSFRSTRREGRWFGTASRCLLGVAICLFLGPVDRGWGQSESVGQPPVVMDLWPQSLAESLPGDPAGFSLPPEGDTSTAASDQVAGRPVVRLGNVSRPQIEIFRPIRPSADRAAIVILPGGGYHILAYDMEGTEVARWLNERGMTAVLLKYRVPARPGPERWRVAVTDAQRAIGLVRHHAADWDLDPDRIGVLGFSAGGHAAAVASSELGRQYPSVDAVDELSCRPNFSLLIYPGYLVDRDGGQLSPLLAAAGRFPPTFLVHAQDDPVTPLSSLVFATHLQKLGVPVELHLYREGGHGYGLRLTERPVTRWPEVAGVWLDRLFANPPQP